MIFYFSGTGNTRWAATQLSMATGEELRFIPEELKGDCHYTLRPGERLGFCFPVHGWQPPHIVRQFISRLQLSGATPYCYALVTCGDSTGLTIPMLQQMLMERGLLLHASFALIMPESYVCLPFMYTDNPQREQQKLTHAAQLITQWEKSIIAREPIHRDQPRGITPWIYSHVIGQWFNTHLITDKHFHLNASQCIACGQCQKVCPTGNITLIDGKPQWNHSGTCTACLACYHHCPHHAINYGPLTKKRGQYFFGHKIFASSQKNN